MRLCERFLSVVIRGCGIHLNTIGHIIIFVNFEVLYVNFMEQSFSTKSIKTFFGILMTNFWLMSSRKRSLKWTVSVTKIFWLQLIGLWWWSQSKSSIILILNWGFVNWIIIKGTLRFQTFLNIWSSGIWSLGCTQGFFVFRRFYQRIVVDSGGLVWVVSHLVIIHCLFFWQSGLINTGFSIKSIFK